MPDYLRQLLEISFHSCEYWASSAGYQVTIQFPGKITFGNGLNTGQSRYSDGDCILQECQLQKLQLICHTFHFN